MYQYTICTVLVACNVNTIINRAIHVYYQKLIWSIRCVHGYDPKMSIRFIHDTSLRIVNPKIMSGTECPTYF